MFNIFSKNRNLLFASACSSTLTKIYLRFVHYFSSFISPFILGYYLVKKSLVFAILKKVIWIVAIIHDLLKDFKLRVKTVYFRFVPKKVLVIFNFLREKLVIFFDQKKRSFLQRIKRSFMLVLCLGVFFFSMSYFSINTLVFVDLHEYLFLFVFSLVGCFFLFSFSFLFFIFSLLLWHNLVHLHLILQSFSIGLLVFVFFDGHYFIDSLYFSAEGLIYFGLCFMLLDYFVKKSSFYQKSSAKLKFLILFPFIGLSFLIYAPSLGLIYVLLNFNVVDALTGSLQDTIFSKYFFTIKYRLLPEDALFVSEQILRVLTKNLNVVPEKAVFFKTQICSLIEGGVDIEQLNSFILKEKSLLVQTAQVVSSSETRSGFSNFSLICGAVALLVLSGGLLYWFFKPKPAAVVSTTSNNKEEPIALAVQTPSSNNTVVSTTLQHNVKEQPRASSSIGSTASSRGYRQQVSSAVNAPVSNEHIVVNWDTMTVSIIKHDGGEFSSLAPKSSGGSLRGKKFGLGDGNLLQENVVNTSVSRVSQVSLEKEAEKFISSLSQPLSVQTPSSAVTSVSDVKSEGSAILLRLYSREHLLNFEKDLISVKIGRYITNVRYGEFFNKPTVESATSSCGGILKIILDGFKKNIKDLPQASQTPYQLNIDKTWFQRIISVYDLSRTVIAKGKKLIGDKNSINVGVFSTTADIKVRILSFVEVYWKASVASSQEKRTSVQNLIDKLIDEL